jgi:hypothetical protein
MDHGPWTSSLRIRVLDLEFPTWHTCCLLPVMLDVMLSIMALIAGGVALELFTDATAASGYRDQHGFPLGTDANQFVEELQVGNPS